MKLNPGLVRGYVLLAIDICRLVWWIMIVASLITNYLLGWRRRNAQLQQPLQVAKSLLSG
jgi:hypothetical protein